MPSDDDGLGPTDGVLPSVFGLGLLGGSWGLVSKVISTLSTLIGVISIVTLLITLVTKSHDLLSRARLS